MKREKSAAKMNRVNQCYTNAHSCFFNGYWSRFVSI